MRCHCHASVLLMANRIGTLLHPYQTPCWGAVVRQQAEAWLLIHSSQCCCVVKGLNE